MWIWEKKKKAASFQVILYFFLLIGIPRLFQHRWNLTMENRIRRAWEEINYLGGGVGKEEEKNSLPTDWPYCALFQETKNCFWCSSIRPWRSQTEQKGRGGTRREGRGEEKKGGMRRKGEGRACTLHVSLLSPNIAFGKEKNENH